MAVITISAPKEDRDFCKSRDLSPSKLFQERVCQIRDEMNPVLRRNLAEEQAHNLNLKKKCEFLAEELRKTQDKLWNMEEQQDVIRCFGKKR